MNWLGLWTLYKKETARFLKVYLQTIIGPVFTAGIFLIIFSLALGGRILDIRGTSFIEFLVPGLIMMAIIQNAFANSSSSIMIAKVQGCIVDILMAPLSAKEFIIGYVSACITRGICVGIAIGSVLYIFVPLHYFNPVILLFYAVMGSFTLGMLGLVAAITSEKFDQLAAYTNFIITPLSFLSGTFYSIDRFHESWKIIAYCNPFFHIIDGFRSGFTGWSDVPLAVSATVLISVNILLWFIVLNIVRSGYKLRS